MPVGVHLADARRAVGARWCVSCAERCILSFKCRAFFLIDNGAQAELVGITIQIPDINTGFIASDDLWSGFERLTVRPGFQRRAARTLRPPRR